jgi:hypothetical protein
MSFVLHHSPCKDIENTSVVITVGCGKRLGINGRIILKLFLRNRIVWCEVYSFGSGYIPVASCCECGNELLVSQEGLFSM